MTRSEAIKAFFLERAARGGGIDSVLYFQIRLYEGRSTGLCVALDTLRPALWPPSDVPLAHTGRRLLWERDRTVCAQFHHRRCDRWFRPGLAAAGGCVLCASDTIPFDRWVKHLDPQRTETTTYSVSRLI